MKKRFMEDKKFRLIVMALVTVVIVTGFSFAWFIMRSVDANQQMSVANFQAEPVCYFEGTDESFVGEDGLITLSTEPGDPNYIGNFRVDVKHKGDGAAYLRVRMVHEYSANGVSTQHTASVPYATSEDWYDNRGNDYCYYYKNEIDADDNTTENTINFITGIDDEENEIADIADGVVIKVAVETDMVQINRYPQVWGIDHLPWK